MSVICGRFAPSPTGLAHLGNAWAFLMAWLAVRARSGHMIFRMEDLDLTRSSILFMQALMSDIRWLGMDWDEGPTPEKERPAYHQCNRYHLYEKAIDVLREKNLLYPCFCSRKNVRGIASAPHIGDAGATYPGTCRNLTKDEVEQKIKSGLHFSLRYRAQGHFYGFEDAVYGHQGSTLEACGGDFNLRRSDGVFSYQLAVSVDDGMMGVTQVVRGRDILPSTPRQIALLTALGYPVPEYGHIPLLLDDEGERLAKRHQSLSLRSLREQGVPSLRIVGLLAFIAGLIDRPEPVHAKELVSSFSLSRLRKEDYRLTAKHMNWLFAGEVFHA